ncbi:MAG: CehA/McbA family metallohydrolase, partial [Actinomycetota bacterium]|nr:CehA/McbA family metallohydrolase [Actinomycetota bacterium]
MHRSSSQLEVYPGKRQKEEKMKMRINLILVLTLALFLFLGGVAAGEQGDELVLKIDTLGTVRAPAKTAPVVLVAGNFKADGKDALLNKLTLKNTRGQVVKTITVGKTLANVADMARKARNLKSKGDSEERGKEIVKLLKTGEKGLYLQSVSLDLEKFESDLQPESTITVQLEAEFRVGGKTEIITTQANIVYLSRQPYAANWFSGDGHIHTAYSTNDSFYKTIDTRVKEGLSLGYSWLIFTDHGPDLTQETWNASKQEALQAMQRYWTSVMIGEELSTNDPAPGPLLPRDPHYLAYGLDSFIPNPEYPIGTGTGRQTIDLVENSNRPDSFGFIAHPNSSWYPWFDVWGDIVTDSKGVGGLEVYNPHTPGTTPATLAEWDQLLRQGKKITGTANSDAHYYWTAGLFEWLIDFDSFGKGTTYLYMPGWSGTDPGAVYEALKKGRAVASSDGSLAMATLSYGGKTYQIGDEVEIASGDAFQINVDAKGVDSKRVSKIRLVSNYADTERYP